MHAHKNKSDLNIYRMNVSDKRAQCTCANSYYRSTATNTLSLYLCLLTGRDMGRLRQFTSHTLSNEHRRALRKMSI